MATIKITNAAVAQLSNASQYDFPKYTTQLINLINSNAQGTRAQVVGQMSELIQQYPGNTLAGWIEWYDAEHPNAIDDATEKIFNKFVEMKDAMQLIDKELIREWVKDLVYTKTFCGLKVQEAVIATIADKLDSSYRLATPEEESRNIDGFIDNKPVQVKSTSYQREGHLSEVIDVPIIYYDKKKDGLLVTYNVEDFL